MINFLSQRNFIFLFSFALTLSLISCSGSKPEEKKTAPSTPSPSTTNSTPPPLNSNSSSSQITLSPDGFSTNGICSLPKEIAGKSPFANLGGGTWEKWGDSEGELDYRCNGGNGAIKLEERIAKINARYGALGGPKSAHYVTAKYTALQYGGKVPVEEQFRQRYLDFCDDLSKKLYGQKLSETFRKRLTDESTYSNSGTANEYHEKIGNGYVNLAARKEKEAMISLEVRFYASEAEYKKYKDS